MKISANQLQKEMSAGGLKLIDVRTPVEFGEMHIEGSHLMPLDRLKPEEVKGNKCVIVCRSGKRASQAMEKLQASGCENLRVLEGGVTAWEKAGLPLNRGEAVMSLERQVRVAAGLLVLIGVTFGTWVHPGFYGLAGFVGAGLIFAGITDWCGMGMVLAKAPWNQRDGKSCSV